MGLELYLDLVSQPCRAVYLFAKRNGISFEFKLVELVRGQHLGEDFGKVNPLRKVPALKDGDFTLAERSACAFLRRLYSLATDRGTIPYTTSNLSFITAIH